MKTLKKSVHASGIDQLLSSSNTGPFILFADSHMAFIAMKIEPIKEWIMFGNDTLTPIAGRGQIILQQCCTFIKPV